MADNERRYALDGTIEWRCASCHQFKPEGKFAKRDLRRGFVCDVCEGLAHSGRIDYSGLLLGDLLKTTCKPDSISKWNRTVWEHIQAEAGELNKQRRANLLNNIRRSKSIFWDRVFHRGFMSLLSSTELPSREYFWFVFRDGLVPLQELRLYTIGAAEYSLRISGLAQQDPRIDEVLFDIKSAAHRREEYPSAIRQRAYDISENLQGEYNPPAMPKAAMALVSVCFPKAIDAAVAVSGWAVETYLASKSLVPAELSRWVLLREVDIALGGLRRLMCVLLQNWRPGVAEKPERPAEAIEPTGDFDYDSIPDTDE